MTTQGAPGKIVVGVDGSPVSLEALRWAAEQARLTGASLHAVIAWAFPTFYGWVPAVEGVDFETESRGVLEDALKEVVGDDPDIDVHPHVVGGHPALVLEKFSDDADLLVVGCRGHGGFSGLLLGSVSAHLVTHATCPVVVIRDAHEAAPTGERA